MTLSKLPVPASWADVLDVYCGWLRLSGQSSESVQLRQLQLGRLARCFPDGPQVSSSALRQWLMQRSWKPETMRSHMSGFRGFFEWALSEQIVSENPCVGLPCPRPSQPDPRPCPDVVYMEALAVADGRTRLMLMLGRMRGLRRGEISRIHVDDVIRTQNGWALHVRGKGGKIRSMPIIPELAEEIRRCDGWVFPNQRGDHMTAAHVGKLIRRTLSGSWTSHTLRHGFATSLYGATHDIVAVQKLLGHSSPETTLRYVAVPETHLCDALTKLPNPRQG